MTPTIRLKRRDGSVGDTAAAVVVVSHIVAIISTPDLELLS